MLAERDLFTYLLGYHLQWLHHHQYWLLFHTLFCVLTFEFCSFIWANSKAGTWATSSLIIHSSCNGYASNLTLSYWSSFLRRIFELNIVNHSNHHWYTAHWAPSFVTASVFCVHWYLPVQNVEPSTICICTLCKLHLAHIWLLKGSFMNITCWADLNTNVFPEGTEINQAP